MNVRKTALLIAAFAGLTTLAWKSVPEDATGVFSADVTGDIPVVWDGVSQFCRGVHRDLSVADVNTGGSRIRQYIVARALEDFCGEGTPALASES